MTAMTAATLDTLSGGRFRLGLGVSGPQVSEGWHGVPFASPLGRTREYVEIVRMALRRDTVTHDGPHYPLPLPGRPGQGAAAHRRAPCAPTCRSTSPRSGPRTSSSTGEIADGWLAHLLLPGARRRPARRRSSRAAPRRPGAGRTTRWPGFDVVADDARSCSPTTSRRPRTHVRDYTALYIGGMGTREQNFYNAAGLPDGLRGGRGSASRTSTSPAAARGRRGRAARVHRRDRAASARRERIAERIGRYAEAGVTTLAVAVGGGMTATRPSTLRSRRDAPSVGCAATPASRREPCAS